MKSIILVAFAALLSISAISQTAGIQYQGVAHDASGMELANRELNLSLSILSGSANGPVEYSETHHVLTDAQGHYELTIGGGTPITSSFSDVDWTSRTGKWISTGISTGNGSSYQYIGTSRVFMVTERFAHYQWYLNDSRIPGATAQSYTPLKPGDYYCMTANDGGCIGKSNTVNFQTTGVNELSTAAHQINVYPNPAYDLLYINGNGKLGAVTVMDLQGRIMLSKSFKTATALMDISSLVPGIYFLKAEGESTPIRFLKGE